MTGHAWVALGGTCKVQRGLKGELHPLKNLTLSAQQATKLVISVVWSLCGQLCALIAPGTITGSSGTSPTWRNCASFQ